MTKKESVALVRPGDINDAIDANDLLNQFLGQNLEVIVDERERRIRKEWASDRNRTIRAGYFARAQKAYESMWEQCSSTKLGHNFIRTDVNGTSIDVCRVCSYHEGKEREVVNNYGPNKTDDSAVRQAKEMNRGLFQIMADKMVNLDVEAGVLVWPEPEDMPERELRKSLNKVPKSGRKLF